MMKPILAASAAMAIVVAAAASPAAASEKVAYMGVWMDADQAAAAAAAAAPQPDAPDWGSTNVVYNVGACEFTPRNGVLNASAVNCVRVEPTVTGTTSVGFPVHLPTGALVTSVKMNYFDNHVANPSAGFFRVPSTGGTVLIAGLDPPAFAGGNASFTATANHTVVNANGSYMILLIDTLDAAGVDGVYGFEINYRLQVSPSPATATFPNDVPTSHPFFRFVEAMAASGLTGGCGPGSFCPDTPVTRGQLSVFLATALGLNFPN